MTKDTRQTTVTRLLRKASAGDRDASDELFPLVYEELRGLARAQRRRRAGARGGPGGRATAALRRR
ncbi:MAG: ECF-type sigma factor [Gemmatimonadota bacterium]|nr:ECF-type sigma factor [Gemmatimonadota bacterium]